MSEWKNDNPLLFSEGLPPFDAVRAEHVVPAVESLLADLETDLGRLEEGIAPTWDDSVVPLEAMGDRLARCWGVVGHLMGVRNDDALREAYEAAQPGVVQFSLRLGQSQPIHRALLELSESEQAKTLSGAQVRILESLLREAAHSGVALEGESRERFNAIAQELAQLSTDFSNRVLDATEAGGFWLREKTDVAGLPQSLLDLTAQSARDAGEADATWDVGPWKLGLDPTCVMPFLQHSTRRDLREAIYRAYVGRAGSGEFDNRQAIERILALRQEQAGLLGYGSYAELSLSGKMASDVEAVLGLLEDLRTPSFDQAREELATLTAFARGHGFEAEALSLWDIPFWAERMREDQFDYSEEALRAYFPFAQVLDGLFDLAQRLFHVRIESADGDAPIWHEDVRFFRVYDDSGTERAAFYLDPYSRPGQKRGGAWMDECVGRSVRLASPSAAFRVPVAYLVCNHAPPVGDQPALLLFDEVQTLFHEFGHGLQHMLTTVDESLASGIRNIEWDAVELPSQFMENWCYQSETLRSISGHVETGDSIPDALADKLRAARTYRAGSDMLRQIYFARTDLELHEKPVQPDAGDAFAIQRRVARETTVIPPLEEDRFLCSFGHIFAGGYAAGYYSYKWAEVLAADAFGAFEEVGLDNESEVSRLGERFRSTVLALGGSRSPGEVFEAFRGRAPRAEALLRQSGLLASS
ncbi:MAG: M3 family metallopeptidase [Myxococcota bacterium]|nr:M3 family metallopeptidase [Myxococcota bacterium]